MCRSLCGSPKRSFSARNRRVTSSVAGLVITYSGIATPYLWLAARNSSIKTWNRVRSESGPTGNIPLGWSKPSRVPSPPATRIIPTLPPRSSLAPSARAASLLNGTPLPSSCMAGGGSARSARRAQCEPSSSSAMAAWCCCWSCRRTLPSIRSIWRASSSCSVEVRRSQNATRCCCPSGVSLASRACWRSFEVSGAAMPADSLAN